MLQNIRKLKNYQTTIIPQRYITAKNCTLPHDLNNRKMNRKTAFLQME